MPFPQWLAGMRITADRLDDRNIIVVNQGEDQIVTNSTTLVDTNLMVPGEVGATYWYHAMISYSSSETPDFRWSWSIPSGGNVRRFSMAGEESDAPGVTVGSSVVMRTPATTTDTMARGSDGDASDPPIDFVYASDEGIITVGGAPGNFTIQFAQSVANANQTIFRNQSRMVFARLA